MGDEVRVEVLERLVRMETKIDLVASGHEARIAKLEGRVPDADHEARIRTLEKAIWWASGAAAALGGLAGSVVSTMLGV